MRKISLPTVTLIAVTGQRIERHREALDKSCEGIEFGAVKLIEKKFDSIDDWCKYIVYNLTDHVDTEHCLLIHDDGYVINPHMWDDKWLEYDYAGSPFPLPRDDFSYRDAFGNIQRVGNSVGLRSKRLLDLPRKLNMPWVPFHGFYNEDGFISVNMRHVFEGNGCKFMPFEEALRFGRETPLPEYDGYTFLFHRI